jgi:UDP:flavonoid glycosyltransferase YjiC (YdhE family)
MATVLLAWELGGGMGHLMQLLPLAESLAARGHRIVAVLRDLSRARTVFGGCAACLQAPIKTRDTQNEIRPPQSFAHILHNICFGDENELASMAGAWRGLFELIRPDLIVFDHAPTAVLASRGLRTRRVLIGTGFFTPPDVYPLPNISGTQDVNPGSLRRDEDRVLRHVNSVLTTWGKPSLERLARLYSDVHENFLTTFPELDHYGRRTAMRYWGPCNRTTGVSPRWPDGSGKRIYAYVKPFPALPELLERLAQLGHPALITSDGVARELQSRYASPTMRFETQPLDHHKVAVECDLAILNANHGTLAHMLLAGKPTLNIPLFLEQGLLARKVRRIGAGVDAAKTDAEQVRAALDTLLEKGDFAVGAARFAQRYAGFSPTRQTAAMVRRIEELLQTGEP